MSYFMNCAYIFAGSLLFSGHEALCGAQKAASNSKRVQKDIGREILIQPVQSPTGSTSKKELFIAGPKRDYLEGMATPEDIQERADYDVQMKLLELYGKSQSLPTLAGHQKALEDRLKQCEDKGNMAGSIAVEITREKLSKQSVAGLKTRPYDQEALSSCRKEVEQSIFSPRPYVAAVEDALNEEVTQRMRKMTGEERKKYYEKYNKNSGQPWSASTDTFYIHSALRRELKGDILQKMATEYVIKSDSPQVLGAVRKAQNKTLFD